jgi:hypothetical protein
MRSWNWHSIGRVAIAVAGVELAVGNLWFWLSAIAPRYFANDFLIYYAAAEVGRTHGWSRIYDRGLVLGALRDVLQRQPGDTPYMNPPYLAWLAAPLTAFAAPEAALTWVLLLVGCLLTAIALIAPADWLSRVAYGGAVLGFFPTMVALAYGQVAPAVILVVVGGWWLLRRDRPVAAGVVLSLVALKPQLGILVPIALAAAGHRRVFAAWAAATAVLVAAAVASLGIDGLADFGRALQYASITYTDQQRFTLLAVLGNTPVATMAEVAAAAIAVLVGRRHRGQVELPIAAGVLGSLVASRFLNANDLAMLAVPAWLLFRAGERGWQRWPAVVLWSTAEAGLGVYGLVAAAALGMLVLLWFAPSAAQEQDRHQREQPGHGGRDQRPARDAIAVDGPAQEEQQHGSGHHPVEGDRVAPGVVAGGQRQHRVAGAPPRG